MSARRDLVTYARGLVEGPQMRGDWHARGCYVYRSSNPIDRRQVARVPAPESADPYAKHPIANFIAASRTLVPTLCDEIERLRKIANEACGIADDLNGDNGDDEELIRRKEQIAALRADLGGDDTCPVNTQEPK
jgi:hypothetical protein